MSKIIFLIKCTLINILFFNIFSGCYESKKTELPVQLQGRDNLIIYQPATETAYEIGFKKEQSFGDNGDVFFQFMYEVGIDEEERVFISEMAMGKRSVHIFDSNGSYLGNIGKQGDGPGEYQTPTNLQIVNGYLYLYDNLHQRISAFSLDSLSFTYALSLPFEDMRKIDELRGTRVQRFLARKDGSFLIGFGSLIPNKNPRYEYYYSMKRDGTLHHERIFEERAIPVFGYRSNNGSFEGMLPFSRKSLTVLSDNDNIYSVWTEDILVRVFDPEGNEAQVFYHPFSNAILDMDTFESGLLPTGSLRHAIPHVDFPETWPAIENMLIDDENWLWISTIVEDFDIYEWWVLEETGEMITRFKWPRNKPIKVIRNSAVYTLETDEETGLQQVVRYGFELVER